MVPCDTPVRSASYWAKGDKMPTVAIITLVIATVIIAAAALGLIRVIFHLVAIRRTLAAVTGGVQVIADKTSTVTSALASVNTNLKPVSDFCESI
jgi:hypothetical protein